MELRLLRILWERHDRAWYGRYVPTEKIMKLLYEDGPRPERAVIRQMIYRLRLALRGSDWQIETRSNVGRRLIAPPATKPSAAPTPSEKVHEPS